jgi:hypothetical protein
MRALTRIKNKSMMNPFKYRCIESVKWSSSANQCAYHSLQVGGQTDTRGIIEKTKAIVPAAGADTVALVDSTLVNRKYVIQAKMKVTMRNNYSFPQKLHFWTVKPRGPQDNAPVTVLGNAMAKEQITDTDLETEIPYWPANASGFMKVFKLYNHRKVYLDSGGECYYYVKLPRYVINESDENIVPNGFNAKNTRWFFCRQEGVVAHSQATTTEIGIGQASLDVVYEIHWDWTPYEQSTYVPEYTEDNLLDTMTAATTFVPEDPGEETFTG